MLLFTACGGKVDTTSGDGSGGSGARTITGGSTSTGGAPTITGGSTSTGGAPTITGGSTGTGGIVSTGGLGGKAGSGYGGSAPGGSGGAAGIDLTLQIRQACRAVCVTACPEGSAGAAGAGPPPNDLAGCVRSCADAHFGPACTVEYARWMACVAAQPPGDLTCSGGIYPVLLTPACDAAASEYLFCLPL